MDELKQIPELETASEPTTQETPQTGCCGGCQGGCPCASAAEDLPETVDDALEEELLPEQPQPEEPAAPTHYTVVDIHFRSGGKTYFFDPDGLELKSGDHVIIDTARGAEYGICSGGCHTVAASEVVLPLRKVLRIATAQDEKIAEANREKEKKAYDVCLQKITEHKLDMQLVSVECAFDGSKLLFFFTSDGRVDFRELVKNLASIFRTRIELRQIGVRDKAKMVGGLGVCGRPFCCSEFLDDFQPVSIKMAKTQNLSLNPTKISGTCGRLMCCLKYEQDAYEDLLKTAPKNESFVDTPDGRGTVCDVNLLRQTVKVRMEDHPETIGTYKNSEIAILRNGKAKKNDPPIPKDLAPISSQPRAARKEAAKTDEDGFIPLVFKKMDAYTATSSPVTEEPAVPTVEPAAETEPAAEGKREGSRRRSRRRRKPAAHGEAAQEQKQESAAQKHQSEGKPSAKHHGEQKPRRDRKPQEQKSPEQKSQEKKPRGEQKPRQSQKPGESTAAAPAAEGGEQKPKPHRRRHHRGRHHRKPGETQAPFVQE